MDFKLIRDLISTIKHQIKCNKCQKKFVYREFDLKDISDSNLTIACNCSRCGNTNFLEVNLKPMKEFGKNRQTKSLKISTNKPRITNNDILDLKNFLKDFSGDFKQIFKK